MNIMNRVSAYLSRFSFLTALMAGSFAAAGTILGTNATALPLTTERLSALPKSERHAWMEYLRRSRLQRQMDQEFLRKEMQEHAVKETIVPPESRSRGWMPLERPLSWYSQAEAMRVADGILSFQTPSGGWSKNLNMSANPRSPGMLFAPGNTSRPAGLDDFHLPSNSWSYIATFDNEATVAQLRFLARVVAASGTNLNARYHTAFLKGLDYIFDSQYPNGGWPQIWPLAGGYHDAITYNDNAMVNILELLRDVAAGKGEHAFVSVGLRQQAERSLKLGIGCLLATQVVVDGRRTAWPQQCDMLTLKPAPARNYEMPSLAAGESANIVMFLMRLPDPGAEVVTAVHSAAAWFEKTAIRNKAFRSVGSEGRLLVSAPGNGPIWARYYETGTDRPLFGDRDRTIHDSVADISRERRAGYSWFGDGPTRALRAYADWIKAHPKE
jgi:PelA/Pel-15E family pectate lyase